MLRYPGRDADGGPAQPATGPSRVLRSRPSGRRCSRRSTDAGSSPTRSRWPPRQATGPIPPASALFDPTADPAVPYDVDAAKTALKAAGWTQAADGWHLPGAKTPLVIELLSPDEASNPAAYAAAAAVARDWNATRAVASSTAPCRPAQFVDRPAREGRLQRRGRRRHHRPRPRPVPVAGLEPDRDRRLERHRAPGPGARRAARGGPRPGHATASAKAAYSALQKQLAAGRYLLPLAFADESVVVRDTVDGPVIRQVADPADRFWDVLTWRLAAGR